LKIDWLKGFLARLMGTSLDMTMGEIIMFWSKLKRKLIWVTRVKIRGQFHQHFTSSFIAHRSQKCKKDSHDIRIFWRFWDLSVLRLLFNMLVKLSLGVNFTNILSSFCTVDPESLKNTVKSSVSFYTFGLCARKSCK